ncbi:hypothetical protein SAMN05216184_10845 [Georgenia satyanarayanai]|uniref:Uncharacterized protein n=1 Tax=Georgenia satyanarayanai TaxID=860221 RepID=A0A2Y9AFI0_9MICO|nr:hypothetical protein [Georgenia satyanarayanai]PYF99163.1 hypothetical protein A8987_10845 [Georgenia satyanarayanai]SSA43281.1 hypothetical protein SAMN05216184_10845 [Georgenia satyanarayanai]
MDADIEILPMLSRGKHRSPRRGACFMELASYLAGERWSDKPACTHPLLAHLARLVNDLTEDAERPRLATLIPAVIGLRSEDPRWDDELTLLAASRALPVVSEHHQRALAVGILSCERRRAERTGEAGLHPASRRALDAVPLAETWARAFVEQVGGVGAHHPGSAVVEIATVGLATACVPDPSGMLRELLADAITLCEHLAGREEQQHEPLAAEQWREVVTPAPLR